MLVSVHLPKTAGTSFRHVLDAQFGESLRQDYDDGPLHLRPRTRRVRALRACLSHALSAEGFEGVTCVHGHFLPLKYRLARTGSRLRFVTWLRDPVERLASHYHYWLRSYDPEQAGALHRRVVEEGWSLEQFCFSAELRNLYSEFLWCFPLRGFAFVGITEHYAEDLRQFSLLLPDRDFEPPHYKVNVNAARGGAGSADSYAGSAADSAAPEQAAPYIADPALRASIEAFHAADVALYRQALQMREARLNND